MCNFLLCQIHNRIYYLYIIVLAVTCPELDISSHEGVRFTKQNDTVIFSCDPGLVLAGNTSMECLIDGSWTGHIPSCYKEGE